MDKTNYEDLLQKRIGERQSRLASVTVLHEIVKHVDPDSLVVALKTVRAALADADMAGRISEQTEIPPEKLVDAFVKVSDCLRFVS
jgi:hypothetical protein